MIVIVSFAMQLQFLCCSTEVVVDVRCAVAAVNADGGNAQRGIGLPVAVLLKHSLALI